MTQNKILILLDGSEFRERILPYVQRFFCPADNQLILLRVAAEKPHGFHIHDGPVRLDVYDDQAETAAAAALRDELLPAVRTLEEAGYTVATAVEFGDTAQQLEHYISREQIDLVAMSTHARTGLAKLVFGSLAEYVVQHVTIPVLLLRTTERTET